MSSDQSEPAKLAEGHHIPVTIKEEINTEHATDTNIIDPQTASTEEQTLADFSSLGSAHDIAAAAMAAAGLDAVMGLGTASETPVQSEDRGVKRSHEEMTSDATEKAVTEGSIATQMGSSGHASIEANPPRSAPSQPVTSTGLSTVKKQVPLQSSYASNGVPIPQTSFKTTPSVSKGPATTSSTPASQYLGIQDLEAVAQAAMGLDANGNPLPGNEESHRALAEAVKRLSAAQNGTTSNGFSRTEGNYAQVANNDPNGPVKRFQCHLCDRAFARAYNLNTHLATHDPDPAKSKPFPCPYPSCKADGGRSFSRKHDLQRHVASTHENEPEPGFDGGVDENGQRIGGLASLGLGTPGRKFRCDDCGRAFVRRDALKRHQCIPSQGNGTATPTSTHNSPNEALTGNVPTALSLYTSTGSSSAGDKTQRNGSASNDASPPFYPSGITYENLTKEVQDMAMQLVAQATSYNEKHNADEKDTDDANGNHSAQSSDELSKVQSILAAAAAAAVPDASTVKNSHEETK